MQIFDIATIVRELGDKAWREFLRTSSLSMGLYRLRAGEVDKQSPHTEDEAYYIVGGRGSFRAGTEERPVATGTVLYVDRGVDHRFFDIEEDLTILVCFAPPEYSLRDAGATPKLTHVNITAPPGSEDAARRFYAGLLGLREIPKPEPIRARGGVWFDGGGFDLHVSVEEGRTGPDAQRHFGLACAKVAELRGRLHAAGVQSENGRPAPWERFFVRDPFGNRIEIHGIGGLRA